MHAPENLEHCFHDDNELLAVSQHMIVLYTRGMKQQSLNESLQRRENRGWRKKLAISHCELTKVLPFPHRRQMLTNVPNAFTRFNSMCVVRTYR